MRRAEQRLEVLAAALGLREEREYAAAVVVEQHDRRVDWMELRREQPVQVVVERDVSDREDERAAGDGGRAERTRDDAVDAIGAAVGEEADVPRAARPERVEVAHRHGIAGE